jgi:lipopolysaccharide export system protein LptA
MTNRVALPVLCCLLVLAGACRSGGRRPRATPPAVADTLAERLARDSVVKAQEDSIRSAAEAPATPPAAPAPELPPRAAEAPAPERRCTLDLPNTPDTRGGRFVDATGKAFTYAGGGIVGNCRGQNIHITADSAESYEVNDLHILIGNVKYREERYAIDAQRVTYFRAEERLLFQGNVHARMTQDAATLDGQQLEYFRAVRGVRERERVVATQRPTLTYVEKDSAGRDEPPITVLGNTIVGEGDSTFYAMGDVRIERTDVIATGDSAMLDGARRFSRLMKGPVVESKGDQPFTLKGRVIDMYGEARQLDRVVALDSANAVSKDFNVVSDTIDLRIADRKLNRAFAFGTSGARATTEDRDVIADSLDIIMPGQRIRELRAIGKAFAESDPDTIRVKSDDRDWIQGDTLIARFDSIAPADTSQPPIRDLYASGQASAYYQMPADSANRSRPGINYVTGRVIRLSFKDGDVETVTVTDQASGVYLVPLPADSAARQPGATRPPATAPAPPRRPPGPTPQARPARWRP